MSKSNRFMGIRNLRFVEDSGKEWPIPGVKSVGPSDPSLPIRDLVVCSLDIEAANKVPLAMQGRLLGESSDLYDQTSPDQRVPLDLGSWSLRTRTFGGGHKELTRSVLVFQ